MKQLDWPLYTIDLAVKLFSDFKDPRHRLSREQFIERIRIGNLYALEERDTWKIYRTSFDGGNWVGYKRGLEELYNDFLKCENQKALE